MQKACQNDFISLWSAKGIGGKKNRRKTERKNKTGRFSMKAIKKQRM